MQRRLVAAEDRVQDPRFPRDVDFVEGRLEGVRRACSTARPVGFSSLIQPVSTAVMNT